jgi:hypothetical protein
MSAKIVLCVIRQILLNLTFLMTDYNLLFFRCSSEEETKNLQVRIFIPGNLTERRGI